MQKITLPWPILMVLCTLSCKDDDGSNGGSETTDTDTDTSTTDSMSTSAGTSDTASNNESSSGTTGGSDTTSSSPCEDLPDGNYADCVNEGDSTCGDASASCLVDDANDPKYGVCNRDCTDVCDCWAAPDTGDATPACKDVSDAGTVCVLDCSEDKTCPDGMKCLVGPDICVFEADDGGTGTDTGTDTGTTTSGTGSTTGTGTGTSSTGTSSTDTSSTDTSSTGTSSTGTGTSSTGSSSTSTGG